MNLSRISAGHYEANLPHNIVATVDKSGATWFAHLQGKHGEGYTAYSLTEAKQWLADTVQEFTQDDIDW